ncbi:hypothetical protein BTVI_71956 [Pitangus sulphuratus]|nr:hypothetical protein BTVI_71956 [Pitangus sulphuratus]
MWIEIAIIFLGVEVKLTVRQFLGSSFLIFLKTGVTFGVFLSSGTSPDHHDLSKIIGLFPQDSSEKIPEETRVSSSLFLESTVAILLAALLPPRPTLKSTNLMVTTAKSAPNFDIFNKTFPAY